MADEAGIGPSEIQVNTLSFQQLCRFQIFDNRPESLSPRERYQLIAVSDKYGYTFVGTNSACVKVIKTDDLARISDENQDTPGCTVEDYPHEKLAVPDKPLHLSINCDGSVLSVVTKGGSTLKLLLYDLQTVCKQAASSGPLMAAGLTKEADIDLVDLLWNPVLPSLFAICLSDGSTNLWVWEEGKIANLSSLPTAVRANAACWSPKGKQIVIGTSDGSLMQFNHTMELKKTVPKPDFTNEPVKVVDILWLSTYMWVVAYIDDDETIQPNMVIVNAPKDQPASFTNFEDICYGSGEDRKAKYYMKFLDKWGFVIASQSNAMDAGVLGQRSDNKTSWDIWTLDDSGRIELPLCEDEDTFPMGFGVDFTSQRQFLTVSKQKHDPVPILLIISSEGLLCPFHVVNHEATESLQQRAEPLPGGGPTQQIMNPSSSVASPASVASPGPVQPAQATSTPAAASQATTAAPSPFSFKPPQTSARGPFSAPSPAVQPTTAGTATTASAPPFSSKPTQPSSSQGGFSFGSSFGSSPFGGSSSKITHPTDEAPGSSTAPDAKPFSFATPANARTAGNQAQVSSGASPFSFKPAATPSASQPIFGSGTMGSSQAKPFSFASPGTSSTASGSQAQSSSGASTFSFKPSSTTPSQPSDGASTSGSAAAVATQPKPFSFASPQATAPSSLGQTTSGAPAFSFAKPASTTPGISSGTFPSVTSAKPAVLQTGIAGAAPAVSQTGTAGAAPPAGLFGKPAAQTTGATSFSFTRPAGAVAQPTSVGAAPGQGFGTASFSFVKPQAQAVQPSVTPQQTAQGITPNTQPPKYQAPASGSSAKGPPNRVAPSMTIPTTQPPTYQAPASGSSAKGPPNQVAPSMTIPTTQPPTYQAPASGSSAKGPPNQVAPPMRSLPFSVTEEPQQGPSSQDTLPKVQEAPKAPANLSVTIPLEQRKGAIHAAQKQAPPGTSVAGQGTGASQVQQPTPSGVAAPAGARERYAPVVEPVSPTSSVTTSVGGEHLESVLMSNISDELENFDREIDELAARTQDGAYTVGREDELRRIRKEMDDLEAFRAGVLECTKSLNEDVHGIKTRLLDSFSLLEESKIRKQRSRDPKFITLLRSRGLDPQTAELMQGLRGMAQYLEVGTRDVNRFLDMAYEESQDRRKKSRSRKLATPTMDTIYHTLRNHHNIMATQRIALEAVRDKLVKAQKYDPIGALYGGTLPSPKFRSDEIGPLALKLSETKLSPSRRGRQTPVSSRKQSMLRDILSRRTQTPIRSSPKVLSGEEEASSPSLSYTSERGHTPPVAFSKKLDFTDAAGPAVSERRRGSETRFQRAITPGRESTPVKDQAKGPALPAYPKTSAPQPAAAASGPAPSRVPSVGGLPSTALPPTRVAQPLKTRQPPTAVPAQAKAAPQPKAAAPPPKASSSEVVKTPPQKEVVTTSSPSSFAHTGTGTVLWGADPSKATPSQLAYAAAMSRISPKGPGASGEPINPKLPPNVNIKNLDSMKSTMPPPVTFAAVASSVDADTAQVVTRVLSEITSTSGRAIPPPGTAVMDTPMGATKSPGVPTVTSTAQSRPQGISSATFVVSPKEAVAEAPRSGGALQTPVASSTPIEGAQATTQPPKFDFSGKNSASATVPGGFFFGSKSTEEKQPATTGPFASSKTESGQASEVLSSSNVSLRGLLADDESAPPPEDPKPASSTFTVQPPSASMGFSFGGAAASKPSFSGSASSAPTSGGTTATAQPAFSGGARPKLTFGGSGGTSSPFGGGSAFSFGQKPVTTLTQGSNSAFSQPLFGQVTSARTAAPVVAPTRAADIVIVAPNVTAPGAGQSATAPAPSSVSAVSLQFGKTSTEQVTSTTAAAEPKGETESAGQFVFALGQTPSTGATSLAFGAPSASTPPASTSGIGQTGSSGMKTTSSAPSLLTGLLQDDADEPSSTMNTTASNAPASSTTGFSFSLASNANKAAPASAATGVANSPFSLAGAASAATTPASSRFSFGSTSTSLFGGSSAGFGSSSSAKPSLFAPPTSGFGVSSSTHATTTTGQSLFGQQPATTSQSLFGQQTTTSQSSFGQPASFGSGGSSLFGQKPAFGQTPTSASKSLFGQSTPSATTTSIFGQPAQATPTSSQSTMSGFEGFGLGGKPDPEAAKINPFGVSSSTGSGSGPFGGANLFGDQGPKAFGSPTGSGGGFGSSGFASSATSGVGTGGFGTSAAGTASSGFGAAPVFGGAPAFGSKPAFGSPTAFGTGAAFSNPLGQSTFGSSPSTGGGPFGASASQSSSSGGFGGFAAQETPSFGGIASNSPPGFGSAAGAGGFGSPQQTGSAFGGANTGFGGFGNSSGGFGSSNTTPSFGSGGSFSQYR